MLVIIENRQPCKRYTDGVTLIELLVCMSIVTILLTLAIPNMGALIEQQKLMTTAAEFYAAVNLTRSEAIKRGSPVSIAANDGVNWKSGWIVFIDTNTNGHADVGETIIFFHEALNDKFKVTYNFTDATPPYVSYSGNGRSRTNASSQQPQAGTVSFSLGENIKRVKVNFLGRAKLCSPERDRSCSETQTDN
ncbi:GspH/FimT family pseudopilin [Undibacterium sp. SXout11W]|uniref:GspH/FimT family pseudopilin n=1 Tax=Undibacterium sp. SXout11W TaxID=3413050 RepID=UPI003BF02004